MGLEEKAMIRFARGQGAASIVEQPQVVDNPSPSSHVSLLLCGKRPSRWSRSAAKRVFDSSCVLAVMPLLIPALLVVALAVKLTSYGPVFFLQKRVGRHGGTFTILKFRTMTHAGKTAHRAVTTTSNQEFTSIGPFLRRWKLDELPQLLNVLRGEMSLVGPRPKMPEHVVFDLPCRPGITGAATIAFAREEEILDDIPAYRLESYVHTVVLPTKRRLDSDYMAKATFLSDFKLIAKSILRRWDTSIAEEMLESTSFEMGSGEKHPRKIATSAARVPGLVPAYLHASIPVDRPVAMEEELVIP